MRVSFFSVQTGNYWVRVRAIGFCDIQRKEEYAVLSYSSPADVSDQELAFPTVEPPGWDEPYPVGVVSGTEPLVNPVETVIVTLT